MGSKTGESASSSSRPTGSDTELSNKKIIIGLNNTIMLYTRRKQSLRLLSGNRPVYGGRPEWAAGSEVKAGMVNGASPDDTASTIDPRVTKRATQRPRAVRRLDEEDGPGVQRAV